MIPSSVALPALMFWLLGKIYTNRKYLLKREQIHRTFSRDILITEYEPLQQDQVRYEISQGFCFVQVTRESCLFIKILITIYWS